MSIKKSIRILGTEIKPGSRTLLNMDIARLHTRTPIEVPVIVDRAKKDGPCILFSGGIHGDETNGVEIVRQLISKKYTVPEFGMVICIPVVNIFGFINQSRALPDGRDLNRVFPGSTNGSLASRFANALMQEIVPHIDYCIDYHTGGGSRFNYSQLRIDGQDEETRKMAEAFGAKFIMFAKNREKSFREASTTLGKKVLLYEGGKSQHLDREVTKVGVEGALRVMQYLGIRNFETELSNSNPANERIIIKESTWVRSKYSGMFRSTAKLGSLIQKGDKIGSVSDPFGDFEKAVKAPHDGYVICNNHSPIVNQGDALVHLAKKMEG